ncbi:PD-(D/E)XK nuclease family protein [Tepidiforma flava]|uniref:PD-(D/E)XK nuclease family protein n=1 Tax=Tepidiforma flava TaxID=3004094 RepID=A0ABY7M8Z3_9CHLR|nr:PD-(D/E)XK nuclease family protein [Tepidiforma flava]WBL36597.1 PD-(D/E)XK nuclease family protein [Tepidiforma flava]
MRQPAEAGPGTVTLRAVGYGEAREALAEVIAGLKGDDPLAPVTVVVASNLVALDTRRWLAARQAVANVRFLVAERFAELLAAPRLQARGMRPRSRWRWLEALRAAAGGAKGPLREVAHHPATLRRLAALAADLRGVPAGILDGLEQRGEPLVAEAVRVIRAAEAAARDLYDDHDLVEEAAAVFKTGGAGTRESGAVVWYLPDRMTAALARLARAAGATVILGMTGDADVDGQARRWCRLLGVEPPLADMAPAAPALPGRLASLPDPDEEVRFAVREAWRLAEAGTPLHRIAILYGNAEQYAALVHERLTASGTPHNGAGARRLADSLAGRAILGALRAARLDWRRDAVADWVTSAPLRDEAGEIPGHAWDALSAEAGVVRGLDGWKRAGEAVRAARSSRAAENPEAAEWLERGAQEAARMGRFVAGAAEALEPKTQKPMAAWGRAAAEAVRTWLPREALAGAAPAGDAAAAAVVEAELAAYDDALRVLDGFGGLPGGGSPVALETFEATLREALDVPAGRHGKLGEGIFAGTIEEASGMAFDHVFLLGLAERVFPPQPSDDPLLPERLRRELDGAVPSAAERVLAARRAYLAAAAMSGSCTATAPRVSLRDQRPAQPSAWFFEAAARLHGSPVYARDLERWLREPEARPGWLTCVDSFAAWVRGGDAFADAQERDLAEICRADGNPWVHSLLEARGALDGVRARAERARASAAPAPAGLGLWSGEALPLQAEPGFERSASALETLTSCPFRYFLAHELRVTEAERPEDLDAIDPAERGSLVHEVLERFVKNVKELRRTESIGGRWSDAERELLMTIADEAFAAYEQRGVTGRPASWAATKQRLGQDLARFLDEDDAWRAATGASIRDAELAFGQKAGRPVDFEVEPGRAIWFRGKADRVDVRDGGELVVIDYKTGKADPFKQAKDSPLAKQDGGWLLQLPIYALAARGQAKTPVRALYWFISEEGKFDRREVALDGDAEEQFRAVVREALRLRELGIYPAVPGKPVWNGWENCRFCPFDRVCPKRDRDRLWERWKQDGRLAGFCRLVLREGDGGATEGEG